jgi:2-polyprenyl-3-methyl-5-hydroxy-6-metoxy-1,4-benzoquinol methylase
MNSEIEAEKQEPYDALAVHYRAVSEARAAYLNAVERILIQRIPEDASSLLDVGAGDGHRTLRLAQARNISNVVLAEPSREMRALCRRQNTGAEIWPVRAEDLPDVESRFSVITCLWNVLGHVEGREKRLAALRRMRVLLEDDGVIFIDLNNRYNAVNYGPLRTFGRMLYDAVIPSATNGDVHVTWHVGNGSIHSTSHVFTPREIAGLLHDAGLIIKQRFVVDYRTGELRRSVFAGQLLFELGKGD